MMFTKDNKVICPICRKESTPPEGDVKNFAPNFTLQNLIELMEKLKLDRASSVANIKAMNETLPPPITQNPRDAPPPVESQNPTKTAKALYTYEATRPGELSFKKGDIIEILSEGVWCKGKHVATQQIGSFPNNYVKILSDAPNLSFFSNPLRRSQQISRSQPNQNFPPNQPSNSIYQFNQNHQIAQSNQPLRNPIINHNNAQQISNQNFNSAQPLQQNRSIFHPPIYQPPSIQQNNHQQNQPNIRNIPPPISNPQQNQPINPIINPLSPQLNRVQRPPNSSQGIPHRPSSSSTTSFKSTNSKS